MNNKKYFDDVADKWDSMRKVFFGDAVREKAYEVAKVEKGKIAADIGAGTGFITEGLLEKGLKIYAIDQSPKMINIMKEKFEYCTEIEYIIADGSSIPLNDDTFDYVFANMYIHHADSPENAINEMVRILRPNGKLVITDLDEHNFEFLKIEQFDRWLGFKREHVKSWFEKSGLKNISVDCAGGNCDAESNCGCTSASISVFVASGNK